MTITILPEASWLPSIKKAYDDAKKRIPDVLRNTDKAEADAKRAASEIAAARKALDVWKAKLGKLTPEQLKAEMPKFSKASAAWYSLASAFYMDSKKVDANTQQALSMAKQGGGMVSSLVSEKGGKDGKGDAKGGGFLKSLFGDEIGIAPIIVAGVILAIASVAFAPAAFDLARGQRVYAETASRELDARIAANAQGRQLQPHTMPAPPAAIQPPVDGGGMGMALAVVGGVVVIAGGVFILMRKG